MKRLQHPLERIVADRQCMGCGFCTLIRAKDGERSAPTVAMEYDVERDHFVPRVKNWQPGEPEGSFVCPGAEMDMVALAKAVHRREPEDSMLGEVVGVRAAYAADEAVRARSASGGVVPALLAHLMQTGRIDAAYCLSSAGRPDEAHGLVVREQDDLARIHGSVYHPARFGSSLKELAQGSERFAFVGLPCEVAGLEMLMREDRGLRERHVLSIGLFCGGINGFRGIDYYLAKFGLALHDLEHIDYRHGSWPGRIRARLRDGTVREIARIRGNTRWNVLRYVKGFQGYWMLPRCRICPDQVADFADIAVGDPHLPRFRNRGGQGFSVLVTRTARGEAAVRSALAAGLVAEEGISRGEVVESQGYTLDNRRHALVYARVGRWLGFRPPRLTNYAALDGTATWRHYRYAMVDMMKLRLPDNRLTRLFYIPWQVFEYVFVTFAPSLIGRRLARLLRNEKV
jgi:coenzyme F420 hydrogenase subunit beta